MSATATTTTNNTTENKSDGIRKKGSFRQQGSYRIFRITNRHDDDDENDDTDKNNTTEQTVLDTPSKFQKKSFRLSTRDGWKRKNSKMKPLLFLHKSSCESTSIDVKTPTSVSTSSHLLPEPFLYGVSSTPTVDTQLLKQNKNNRDQEEGTDWSDTDALAGAMDDTMTHDAARLDDLLVRAVNLETNVKKQDFVKIQPGGRGSFHRNRKRFVIACGGVLVALTIIITIIVFVVIMTVRHKAQMDQLSASKPIKDPSR